jgi:hypothetical protein
MRVELQLLNALQCLEDENPASAKEQESRALADLQTKISAREQIEAQEAALQQVEIGDKEAVAALREQITAMTSAVREKRQRCYEEIRNTPETCDVRSLAQELRTDDDVIALMMSSYAEAIEVVVDQHRLETMEVQATLYRARANEISAAATLGQLQTLATLGPASRLEGRIAFIGARTQELLAAATEQDRLADAAASAYQATRAAVEAKLRARDSHGPITGVTVTRH